MAVVVERNVLEWRFDLMGGVAMAEVTGYNQEVVVVCSEGYASSLAATSLRELGFVHAADLDGGFRAWTAWLERMRWTSVATLGSGQMSRHSPLLGRVDRRSPGLNRRSVSAPRRRLDA